MRATSKMKKININGWTIEVLPSYHTDAVVEQLEDLMKNHIYNANINWEQYRKVGRQWRKKKQQTS